MIKVRATIEKDGIILIDKPGAEVNTPQEVIKEIDRRTKTLKHDYIFQLALDENLDKEATAQRYRELCSQLGVNGND